jgi:chromosome segregation ATPase
MSDNPTQEMPDSRSFEERVFARFDALDARINNFESRIEAKVDALDGRLITLEEKVDARLRETRPIWEAVQTRLEGVENRLGGVEERLGGLESEVRRVRRIMKSLPEDVLSTRAEQTELEDDFEKLDERVEKLESESTR